MIFQFRTEAFCFATAVREGFNYFFWYYLAQFHKFIFLQFMNQTLQQYLLKNDIDKNGLQIPTLYQCSLRLSIALPSWKFIPRNCHFKCRRSTSIPLNHMPLLRNLGEKDFNFVIPVSFNNVTMTIF